jgi:Domain of unknown function (DUF5916)
MTFRILPAICIALCLNAQTAAADAGHRITYADSPLTLDGRTDEALWDEALSLPLSFETSPGENVAPPVHTVLKMTYSRDALLIAFLADDPDPQMIVANLADRDTPFDDDYVGLVLDTFNDQRRGFAFMVTAAGVQMDMTRNEVGNEIEDLSWDAIWSSAAHVDEHGYSVEMVIPFAALRYPDQTGDMTWGLSATRYLPRHVNHVISLTPDDRDNPSLLAQAVKLTGFGEIGRKRDVELAPSLTGLRNDQRPPGGQMQSGDFNWDLGASGRWGITPNLSLDAAVNPDFSQVEADELQLDVNTRYALEYQEKRPFFLEGADVFATPLQAVYTRTIFDPTWGSKLSGKTSNAAVGVFLARDELTSLLLPSNTGSTGHVLDAEQTTGVMRYRHDLGESSTIGALATAREGDQYHNRTGGLDAHLRLTPSTSLAVQYLRSDADYPLMIVDGDSVETGNLDGGALHMALSHQSRDWSAEAAVTDIDEDFRADAGFMPRVDFRQYEAGLWRTWWGDKSHWFNMLGLGAIWEYIENQDGRMTDRQMALEANYMGPMQTRAWLAGFARTELYGGRSYDLQFVRAKVGWRPTADFIGWLGLWSGEAVDYMNNRPATRYGGGPGFSWSPRPEISLQTDMIHEYMAVDDRQLYRVNLVSASLVYHFNTRSFLRATVRYRHMDLNPDNYLMPVPPADEQLFTQLLFSHKVNPRTVLFLGTTSNLQDYGLTPLTVNDHTYFLKIGYAWQP